MAGAAALEAAIRRVDAAASVKRVLPQFDELATAMVARSGVPGVAIAVVSGDTAGYVRCFGLRQIGRADSVDKDTLFQLGGVSQGFTTTMMAGLVDDGEIDWDQPVREVWPGFSLFDRWAARSATFRDLAAMRSGLPAYAGAELADFGYGRAEILRRLRYLEPASGFRTAYAPQDALPTAAAVAAERASGRSWASLVRATVLEPLGTTSATTLTNRRYLRASDRATPHRLENGSMRPQMTTDETLFAPARGVSASIAGLVPYVRMHLNGGALGGVRVSAAATLAETLAPTTPTGADAAGPTAFALGWETLSYDGRLVVRATGDLESGSSALIALVPGDGVGIIVLANAAPEGGTLARALAGTLFDLYLQGAPREDWLAEERTRAAEAADLAESSGPRRLPPRAPGFAAEPRARSVYEGVFANRYYGRVSVHRGPGDVLRVRLGRGINLRYLPWDGDVWREVDSGTAASFDVRAGRAVGVRIALLAAGGRDGRFRLRD